MSYVVRFLGSKSCSQIVNEIGAIPREETSLDLRLNFLGRVTTIYGEGGDVIGCSGRSADELIDIVKAIPAHITSVDLGLNMFNDLSNDDLLKVLSSIPATVIDLNLSGNDLFKTKAQKEVPERPKPLGAVVNLLTKISLGIRILRLDYNNFDSSHTDALVYIPAHVTAIHLRGSNLDKFPIDKIILLIRTIPRHVTFLDLGENFLTDRTEEEIQQIAAVIPAGMMVEIGFHGSSRILGPKLAPTMIPLVSNTGYAGGDSRLPITPPSTVKKAYLNADIRDGLILPTVAKVAQAAPSSLGASSGRFYKTPPSQRPSTTAPSASQGSSKLPLIK